MARKKRSNEDIADNLFLVHPGGVTKQMLVTAGIPDAQVAGTMVELRKRSTDSGHMPIVTKIDNQWVYGYAELISQHLEEQFKRWRYSYNSAAISAEMYKQTVIEHPHDFTAQTSLDEAENTLRVSIRMLKMLHLALDKLGVKVKLPAGI